MEEALPKYFQAMQVSQFYTEKNGMAYICNSQQPIRVWKKCV